MEEPIPKQPFSTLALPQGVASLGRALWADKAWTAPLQGPLLTCRLFTLSDQALFTV